MARFFVLMLLAAGIYGFQHQHTLKRWWGNPTAFFSSEPTNGLEIIVIGNCCKAVTDFFARAGVPHTVTEIDPDSVDARRLGPYPVIVDGSRREHGFDEELYRQWYVERPVNATKLAEAGFGGSAENGGVLMFATDWCGYCAKARAHFAAEGIPYRELNVERDPQAAALQLQLSGSRGVPLIFYDNMMIRGFGAQRFDAFKSWSDDA